MAAGDFTPFSAAPDVTDMAVRPSIDADTQLVPPTENEMVTAGEAIFSPLEFDKDSATKQITPKDANAWDIGSTTKPMKAIRAQSVILYDEDAGNPGTFLDAGNLDADQGSLGLYGGSELALGYGNNNKDLVFDNLGVTLNKTMTVSNGNAISFQDGDSTQKEGVTVTMDGNDLAFFSVNQGTQLSIPPLKLSYDGHMFCKNNKIDTGASSGSVRTSSADYSEVCSTGSIAVECSSAGVRLRVLDSTTHYFIWGRSGSSVSDGYGSASGNFGLGRPSGNGQNYFYSVGVRGTTSGIITVVIRRESDAITTCQASIMVS